MKVSIAVITYNSASTITDTLDSIVNQDYGSENIELVISDDASIDDTVEVIHKWLDKNSSLFFLTNFLENPINKGVSANINQAWKATSCEWIKSIAGDDMLRPNCISDNVKFIDSNPECKILFSKMKTFGEVSKVLPSEYDLRFFNKTSKEQNKYIKVFSFNVAPSSFINKKLLEEMGFADERYRMIEDLPLWLKITKAGYKLYFMNIITVDYRVGNSVTASKTKCANIPFLLELIAINKKHEFSLIREPLISFIRLERLIQLNYEIAVATVFKNERSVHSDRLMRLSWVLRPAHFTNHLFKKLYNRAKLT